MKNTAIFLIIFSFLYSTVSLANNNDNSSEPYPPRIPDVWHVVWDSSTAGPVTALWTRVTPHMGNTYYGVWNNDLRASLTIDAGIPRFEGNARMNNGDDCEISGRIYDSASQEKIFDGHYTCAKGDKGTITGSIKNN